MVQFAKRPHDSKEYAVKFFLDRNAFYTEAALYAAYFPALRRTLSFRGASARSGGEESAIEAGMDGCGERISGARFLPHVEAVCDSEEAGLCDPKGKPLPPCIVMERGESLQEWSGRAEPDHFTSFAVRTFFTGVS